ncbi:membrane protein [Lipingzhangella halophila]|uniref:Membrane protein n=1 Tax=Lipingzhangella halophila TaxID=1783352 RepID=A0A7W7RL38_9ACTN|nr:YihY/virulence factor BrkB family protein [Lipingzhangella halophila]MBB4933979.1 membrane protein [Lipingzhangella halophila]
MPSITRQARDRARHYRNVAMESFWAARRHRPAFDHLVRAYERFSDQRGNQLAASVTYYAFLSFFPLLALAFAVAGYLAAFHVEARHFMEQAISEVLPGLSQELPIETIADARTGAGILGVLGLLYAGLGAVSALREALHVIWLNSVSDGPNFVLAKVIDTIVMVVLGTALLASVVLTSVLQTGTRWLLGWMGLDEVAVLVVATRTVGLAVAIAVSTLIFLVLFSKLSGTRRPWRLLWRGALLAAVGFEILKALGALLLAGTLGNPVYASFAVLVGLLVWMNIVLRMVFFAAAWTATRLPVAPPYPGAVPMAVPAGGGAAEPHGLAARESSRPRPGSRGARVRGVLWRTAVLTGGAAALAGAVWWLRQRFGGGRRRNPAGQGPYITYRSRRGPAA